MIPTTALQRLAHYAGQVTGVRATYPAPPTVVPPHLIIFWDESTLTESGGEQLWMMTARADLLMSVKGNTSGEIITADALIAPIADAFTSDTANHAAYHLQTADGTDRVDYCRLERKGEGEAVEYAGHIYYGTQLYFGIKLRRFAGS